MAKVKVRNTTDKDKIMKGEGFHPTILRAGESTTFDEEHFAKVEDKDGIEITGAQNDAPKKEEPVEKEEESSEEVVEETEETTEEAKAEEPAEEVVEEEKPKAKKPAKRKSPARKKKNS